MLYGLAIYGLDAYRPVIWDYGKITTLADRIQKFLDCRNDGTEIYIHLIVKCRQCELVVLQGWNGSDLIGDIYQQIVSNGQYILAVNY